MVQQAPLASKLLLSLLISFGACNNPDRPLSSYHKMVNKSEQRLYMLNGLLMENKLIFSGTVYTLFPGTTDTATLSNYFNGKEEGEWKMFYRSKKLKEKRYFANGKKTGEYVGWWENGNKQLQYYFLNDEYEGLCKEWNEAGAISKIMNYKKGYEDGHQQWWYDNGKVKANYFIKNGRRYGLLGTKNCINVSDSIFKN